MAKCRSCGEDNCCSIPAYVDSLDLSQLRNLIEHAERKIKFLQNEKKHL